MSDRIEGVAILDETLLPSRPARLHFICVRANGDRKPWADSIPVRPTRTPVVPGWSTWEFLIDADVLWMRPSVKMSHVTGYTTDVPPKPIEREFFHNEGLWGVRFVRWTRRAEFVDNGGGCDFEGIHAKLRELNPDHFR